MSIWDDPEVQPTGGDFVKFENVGDSVVGTITAIRKQRFQGDDGDQYAPQLDLTLDDGTEVTLTAGQWQLKKLLIEQRPDVGDRIKVVHTGKQGRSKLFTLAVKRGASAEAEPAPAKADSATTASLKKGTADDGFDSDDDIPF